MPSERQIGITGVREPERCAVTNRDVRGKHAVTHYGPNGQYVYVLAQVDHLWPQAAPAYGFPVQDENPAQDENVFVLETTNDQIDPRPDVRREPVAKKKSWASSSTDAPKEAD